MTNEGVVPYPIYMFRKATNKAKSVASKAAQTIKPAKQPGLTLHDAEKARHYIDEYWDKLVRKHPHDEDSLLGLPHPYLVPSYDETASFDYNELYYWDSYFMVQGMLHDTKHKDLVVGILENLLYLFERYRVIPNASRTYLMGRSQPPFLTSFIFDVYNAFEMDREWLRRAISIAEAEYNTVWMGTKKPNERLVHKGLSRYYDINYLHDLAEAESGWDMTPRFSRRALDYLPVDLNALLYKYEKDFARAALILEDPHRAAEWEKAAEKRKTTMGTLMWDKLKGLYFDYDFKKGKRGTVSSLAAYFPLWAGMVTEQQADALVKSLRKFENKGGLATTDALPIGQFVPGSMPVQWAFPNGWAPLQFIVIEGLLRYGYREDAERIARKWLKTNIDWFNVHGVFLEKYNVISPDKPPQKGVYPSQTGFGWTNAVFERFCQQFLDD